MTAVVDPGITSRGPYQGKRVCRQLAQPERAGAGTRSGDDSPGGEADQRLEIVVSPCPGLLARS
jgi:hypothetical protein